MTWAAERVREAKRVIDRCNQSRNDASHDAGKQRPVETLNHS